MQIINFRKDYHKGSYPLFYTALFVLMIILLTACSEDTEDTSQASKPNDIVAKGPAVEPIQTPLPAPVVIVEAPVVIEEPSLAIREAPVVVVEEGAAGAEAPETPRTIDQYKVELAATTHLSIPGPAGELRVWIGSDRFDPQFPTNMTSDSTPLPAEGETAKVDAFAPDFEVDPIEAQCIKIHPQGSEIRFKITPETSGSFHVGANVNLFDSSDCSGAPIPRTTATLEVSVIVDSSKLIEEKVLALLSILWSKLLEFWEALLVSIFGIILFLAKDKLKNLFGVKKDE